MSTLIEVCLIANALDITQPDRSVGSSVPVSKVPTSVSDKPHFLNSSFALVMLKTSAQNHRHRVSEIFCHNIYSTVAPRKLHYDYLPIAKSIAKYSGFSVAE